MPRAMTMLANTPVTPRFIRPTLTRPAVPKLQEQLGRAEVTGSMARLREELEESKAANAKLHMEQTRRQQEWQQQILRSQAEHDNQVKQAS